MTSPTKRRGSENWHFRKRLPPEIKDILTGLPKGKRPHNWFANEICISLGTPNRDEAKAKWLEVAADVERTIAALKEGPAPLTHLQIAALAGELYKAFALGLHESPVLTPEQWSRVAQLNAAARQGQYGAAALGIYKTEEDRRAASMEARFGAMVDAFLINRGLVTDTDSRWKLIDRGSIELSKAAATLADKAAFNYEEDVHAANLPKFEHKKDSTKQSLKKLAVAWHKAALDRDVRPRDADRIKSRFEKLIAFLKHDDPERLTAQDIVGWRDHRLAEKKSIKTINDSDIASFNNVLNWGVERGWLTANPAKGATIKTKRKKAKNRDEFFSADEAAAILRHSTTVSGSKREDPKTTAAKRWVPWLLAYSGARVAEMIQLRKQDLRNDPGYGWVIRLTPEAGSIKTNKFCDVPVHEHLIAEGFIEFVTTSRDGHLFCHPAADGSIDGPAEGVYGRIRTLVRTVIKDKDVAPNHGWRYTFKTYGLEAGIEEPILDAISNHEPKHQGGKYTKVTLKAKADAMTRFPRYGSRLRPACPPLPPLDDAKRV